MKSKLLIQSIILITLVTLTLKSNADDWTYIVDLEGSWQFSVGDDIAWAKPTTDVSDWDKINVPGDWEIYYEKYNGYAWYRKTFNIKSMPGEGPIALLLGYIDDVDEVYINGVKVGQSGSFFPNYKSAYNVERRYYVQRNILKSSDNVIAIRVYDEAQQGGIVSGNKIGLCYDNDYSLLSFDLSGSWKFGIYRESDVTNEDFNDSKWKSIIVPGTWESQGFPDHDGYGWYRKKFTIPSNLKSQKLYLVLGKIDDTDRVYLNGKQLGRTESKNYNAKANSDYRKRRIYEIPDRYIKSENVIVIEVHDYHGVGGIYEGPVGFMTEKNVDIYKDRIRNDYEINSFGDFINFFFD